MKSWNQLENQFQQISIKGELGLICILITYNLGGMNASPNTSKFQFFQILHKIVLETREHLDFLTWIYLLGWMEFLAWILIHILGGMNASPSTRRQLPGIF